MSQFSFSWPALPSYETVDFIVTDANREAAAFIDQWPDAAPRTGILVGPPGSGKTHLAHRFNRQANAVFIDSALLGVVPSPALWQGRSFAVLEDIHDLREAQPLFHLLRHCENHGLHLLLTSRMLPRDLPFTLPDLQSRLRAAPLAQLLPPDEALLKAFLIKGFTDRQLRVGEEAITWLLKRMERSFSAAHALIEAIENEQNQTHRPITIPFLKSFSLYAHPAIMSFKKDKN